MPWSRSDPGQRIFYQSSYGLDFFRFDVTEATASGGNTPHLHVTVETRNQRDPNIFLANLDTDLEVWFNDPNSGWREITSAGMRVDASPDLWAEWRAESQATPVGEYAVGVKSRGFYGDLGHYTVEVRGSQGLRIDGAKGPGRPKRWGLRRFKEVDHFDDLLELLQQSQDESDLVSLLSNLATHGVSGETVLSLAKNQSLEPSEEKVYLAKLALIQMPAAHIIAELVDWSSLDEGERKLVASEIEDGVSHIETSWTYQPADNKPPELVVWAGHGENHECPLLVAHE